jgi:hypothetical protein
MVTAAIINMVEVGYVFSLTGNKLISTNIAAPLLNQDQG